MPRAPRDTFALAFHSAAACAPELRIPSRAPLALSDTAVRSPGVRRFAAAPREMVAAASESSFCITLHVRTHELQMAATRTRRTEEQRIEALEAQIAALKQRAERKKLTRDPALKHVSAALRSIDKALSHSEDAATRQALDEARATLSAALSINGVAQKASLTPRGRRGSASVESDVILDYVRSNPGQRGEQIAAALNTDTKLMRPVMHRLIDERKVKTKGQRRGMQYFAS